MDPQTNETADNKPQKNSAKRFLLIVGIIFVAAGLSFNRYTIGTLFRPFPRPITGATNLLIIYTFEAVMVALGALLVWKRKTITFSAIGKQYVFIASSVFAALALFVLLNIAIYAAGVIKGSIGNQVDQVTKKYKVSLESFYPGLTRDQIAQLSEENWSRPPIYQAFTEHTERPIRGTYVNVDENGFRYVLNQAAWPPDPKATNIFVFGGSTTFGYGVADKDTIASYLQQSLRETLPQKNIAVYNFGVAAYYSSQERILLQKLIIKGYVPDYAIFVDGLNDSDFGRVNDEGAFSGDLAKLFNSGGGLDILNRLPLVELLKNQSGNFKAAPVLSGKERTDDVQKTLARYLTNKKITGAITAGFGIKTLFVWQPVPYYKYDISYSPFNSPDNLRDAAYVYPEMAKYRETHDLGKDFVYLADMQENEKKALYVDAIHYGADLSREIGFSIADSVKANILNSK